MAAAKEEGTSAPAMDRIQGVLGTEEIDFLMKAGGKSAEAPAPDPATAEVTMRGDLEQIGLPEIFQTLGIAKMEGRLRVRSPLEQRDMFFLDGQVRNVVPHRTEVERFGLRLVQTGIWTVDAMRTALLDQKKTGAAIAQGLVASGACTKAQADDILADIEYEDLLAVFTWRNGSFEFYKGERCDVARLGPGPSVEVNSLLLEVAKRTDEWQTILRAVHDMDEVLAAIGRDDAGLANESRDVLAVVDGQQSVREVADRAGLGLFACARQLRDLKEAGLIDFLGDPQMLELAEQQLVAGNPRRATVTLRTLWDRPRALTNELAQAISRLLARCGEARLAGRCMMSLTLAVEEPGAALEAARAARSFDPRSIEALAFLQKHLPADEEVRGEWLEVSIALADAHAEEGQIEDALSVIAQIEAVDPKSEPVLTRKARMLHRANRPEDAIGVLLAIADSAKAAHDQERLAQIYEQILKIDYRRRDIARALKALHATRLSRVLRYSLIGTGTLLLSGVLWLFWSEQRASSHLVRVADHLQALLEDGDLDQAHKLYEEALAAYGDCAGTEVLRSKIDAVVKRQDVARMRARQEAIAAQVALAVEQVERGEIATAAQGLKAMPRNDPATDAVRVGIKARLGRMLGNLEALARDLPFQVPPPPDPLQHEASRRQVLADLDQRFRQVDRAQAQGALASKDDPTLVTLLGDEHPRLIEAASVVARAFEAADKRREEYQAALHESEAAHRLEPIFAAAKEHAERHEFAQALAAYRKLAVEYQRDDELRTLIRDMVDRYAAIVRYLEVLQKATLAGDFAAAQGQMRTLRQTYPEIPFEKLATLPLRVETTPCGAQVQINGQAMGKTPLLTAYFPHGENKVRIDLDGFLTEETTVRGDDVGIVRSLLARRAQWTIQCRSSFERQPRFDGEHVLVVDRSGALTALNPRDGQAAWTFASGDLSALHPTPVVSGDCIVLASADGKLRGLDRSSGSTRWEVDGIPCESNPIAVGRLVVLATSKGALLGCDPAGGQTRWTTQLPGAVNTPLLGLEGRVYACTGDGQVTCATVMDGRVLWQARLGHRISVSGTLAGDTIVYAADDGTVTALRSQDGERLWSRGKVGEVAVAPTSVGRKVFLGLANEIVVLNAANGAELMRNRHPVTISADLVVLAEGLAVGGADGLVQVLDPETLAPRYRLRGRKRVSAPPLALPGGMTLALFDDRSVAMFAPLAAPGPR